MSANKTKATVASAVALAMVLPAVKVSEGYWPTVKVDIVGTGQPCTGGYGETDGVRCGETHSETYWSERLGVRLKEYDARLGKCIHVDAPDSVRAAMITTSYNAGTAAVCRSPMVAKINAGDFHGACSALLTKDARGNYTGWYIRAQGRVVRGLINRRRDDQKMCLSGVDEKPRPAFTAPTPTAKDGQPCYGQTVDDRTYTSHPECRAPLPASMPASAVQPLPAPHSWYSWIWKHK